MAKSVLTGLVTPCRLAGRPTRRSPSPVKATIDGVVLAPSEFSRTWGFPPSITATQELVVPRSIPITFAMLLILFLRQTVRTRLNRHPAPLEGPHDLLGKRSPRAAVVVWRYIVGVYGA